MKLRLRVESFRMHFFSTCPRRTSAPRLLGLVFLVIVSLTSSATWAHDLSWTPTHLTVDPEAGSWSLQLRADLDALALGAASNADNLELRAALAELSAEEVDAKRAKLENLLRRRVRIRFDGTTDLPSSIELPEEGSRDDTWFGLEVALHGDIPLGSETVTVRLSRAFPPAILRVDRPGSPTWHRILAQGTPSPALPLLEPVLPLPPGTILQDYLHLGFLHILPRGADHVLFVLCLFLLSPHWRPLLLQVSAFTLAHTVTLALATLGLVRLSPDVVEPLIAASIVVLAIENLWTRELHAWRPAIVFLFGLLHGLGFAGVLGDVGIPEESLVPALIGFNVGVELGQLSVLGLAFLAVGWLRHRPDYRSKVAVPLSCAIAVLGSWWVMERTFLG